VLKTQFGSIKAIGPALDELIGGLGIKKKLQEYDAVVFWEMVVGKQISKMTTARRITQGVLFVHVKTSTWRNELTLRKKEIIDKLNTAIGFDVVKDIKFH
jgi:predicted nucleic acid-binding Zn ribbon protein